MLGRIKNMKLRYKIASGAAAGALVLGGGGAAFAYFTTTGSNTGTATAGSAGVWAVSSVTPSGGSLYPGQGSNTLSAVIQNTDGNGNQGLNHLVVSITSVTEHAPGNTFTSAPACTTADFALSKTANWVISTASTSNDTATYTPASPQDITHGHFVVAGADSATTGNALPSGLSLAMVDNTSAAQDQCQGATVTLTVAAN